MIFIDTRFIFSLIADEAGLKAASWLSTGYFARRPPDSR